MELDTAIKYYVGNYDYNNAASQQSIVAGDWRKLVNDGEGDFSSNVNKVTGIDDIYNKTIQQFDFSKLSIGDRVDIRFTFEYEILTVNTEIEARLLCGIGDVNEYPVSLRGPRLYSKAKIYPGGTTIFWMTMDNQFTIDNPAQVEIFADKDCKITVTGYKISVTKRGL